MANFEVTRYGRGSAILDRETRAYVLFGTKRELTKRAKELNAPKGRCAGCEVMVIQGVRTHERGCFNAWEDEIRECNWCGSKFRPDSEEQHFCADDCSEAFNG